MSGLGTVCSLWLYWSTYLVYTEMHSSRLRRPVSQMTVVEQQLEGEFRYVNSRLITHRYPATALYVFYCVVLITESTEVRLLVWCLSVCPILAAKILKMTRQGAALHVTSTCLSLTVRGQML